MGTVLDVADMGSGYDIFVGLTDGVELLARTSGALSVAVGSRCRIEYVSAAISLWPSSDDRPLGANVTR